MTFKPTFTLQTYNLNSTFEIKFKNIYLLVQKMTTYIALILLEIFDFQLKLMGIYTPLHHLMIQNTV